MPRVKSRDDFGWTYVAGSRIQLLNWKFVEPGYTSERRFIFFEDMPRSPHRADVDTVAKAYLNHYEAHLRGTCDCGAALEKVESVAPRDGRTQLICEEVV